MSHATIDTQGCNAANGLSVVPSSEKNNEDEGIQMIGATEQIQSDARSARLRCEWVDRLHWIEDSKGWTVCQCIVQYQHHLLARVPLGECGQQSVPQPSHVDAPIHVVVVVAIVLLRFVDQLAGGNDCIDAVVVHVKVVREPPVLRERMHQHQTLALATRPHHIVLLRQARVVPGEGWRVMSVDVRLVGIHDDTLTPLLLQHGFAIADEEHPDAGYISWIVHLSNHIPSAVAKTYRRQHAAQHSVGETSVVLGEDSILQALTRTATSRLVGVPDVLGDVEDHVHADVVGMVEVSDCSSASMRRIHDEDLLLVSPVAP